MSEEKNGTLLDLGGERVVAFRDRGHLYKYFFDRISRSAWERYFNGIVVTSQNQDRVQTTVADLQTAAMQLVESAVTRVEGYRGDFHSKPNWREVLPVGHVRLVSNILRQVEVSKGDFDMATDPEHIDVVLEAQWGVDEEGHMVKHTRLVHTFRPPGPDQKLKYNRAMASSKVVGGSRMSKTIYVPKQKILLDFYDQLIERVEGYCVNGTEFHTGEQARSEMDGYHKVIAVADVFAEPDADDGAAEAEAA